ncbi:MAG TPA: alpha/beta fold hydrolase [Waddliaceae bacterium]
MSSADATNNLQTHRPELELTAFERMTKRDRCDVLTTIVAPILLIIAIGLTIHYVLHPIAPLIQITPTFSMSLPLMICSGGGLVSAITLIVQLIRHTKVKIAFERGFGQLVYSSTFLQELVRYALHPGGREGEQTAQEYCDLRKDYIAFTEQRIGKIAELPARDKVELRGYWHKEDEEAPTVILFHGNVARAEHWHSWGSYYKNLGFNVLMMEYRGYGISEGKASGKNQELEAYYDAEAAYQFVLSQNVQKEKVLAHGYSLGGAYAAALGHFFEVKNVVLDHTFTSFAAVFANVAPLITGPSTDQVIGGAYTHKRAERNTDIPGSTALITDGFNSLKKIKETLPETEIFVIRGERDNLMKMEFGDAFVQAKYGDKEVQQRHLVTIAGGHCDGNEFFGDESAKQKFENFLKDRGLLVEKF